MSGVLAQNIADYSVGAYGIALALPLLLFPAEPHGEGIMRRNERVSGAFFLIFGLIFLLSPPVNMTTRPAFLLGAGAGSLGWAVYELLVEPRLRARKLPRDDADHANSQSRPPPRQRLLGTAIAFVFGGLWLALGLTIPR